MNQLAICYLKNTVASYNCTGDGPSIEISITSLKFLYKTFDRTFSLSHTLHLCRFRVCSFFFLRRKMPAFALTSKAGDGQHQFQGKNTPYVWICGIVASTGGLMFGYDIGISGINNGTSLHIKPHSSILLCIYSLCIHTCYIISFWSSQNNLLFQCLLFSFNTWV